MSSFLAATTAAGTDSFDDVSNLDPTPGPLARTAGAYTYTANVTEGEFFGGGTAGDHWVSPDIATNDLVFSNFAGGVSAIGGLFFDSDVFGAYTPGDITVTVTDASGTTTQTIVGATTSSFLGFVSTGGLVSLQLTAVQPDADAFNWASANDLVLAQGLVTAVPEPETYALMLAGLGVLGLATRRHSKRTRA